jgi:hypothetical protein
MLPACFGHSLLCLPLHSCISVVPYCCSLCRIWGCCSVSGSARQWQGSPSGHALLLPVHGTVVALESFWSPPPAVAPHQSLHHSTAAWLHPAAVSNRRDILSNMDCHVPVLVCASSLDLHLAWLFASSCCLPFRAAGCTAIMCELLCTKCRAVTLYRVVPGSARLALWVGLAAASTYGTVVALESFRRPPCHHGPRSSLHHSTVAWLHPAAVSNRRDICKQYDGICWHSIACMTLIP